MLCLVTIFSPSLVIFVIVDFFWQTESCVKSCTCTGNTYRLRSKDVQCIVLNYDGDDDDCSGDFGVVAESWTSWGKENWMNLVTSCYGENEVWSRPFMTTDRGQVCTHSDRLSFWAKGQVMSKICVWCLSREKQAARILSCLGAPFANLRLLEEDRGDNKRRFRRWWW